VPPVGPLVLAGISTLYLAAAAPVGYVRATSTYKSDSRPTLYQPLLLLDGRENTAWCTGAAGDGIGEVITVGFKGVATIDELRIATGDGKDEATWKSRNRVRKIIVHEERFNREIILADNREPQSYKFDPPIEGERLFFEIGDVYRGASSDGVTCISDIVFVTNGKPLDGPFLAEKIGYDSGRAQVMNMWASGPEGTPEKFLSLYYDGTFHFRYVPIDPDVKGKQLAGEYRYEGGKLLLKYSGVDWVDAKAKRERIGSEDGSVVARLILKNPALAKEMLGTYVDKW
jgi:hypothetical protein